MKKCTLCIIALLLPELTFGAVARLDANVIRTQVSDEGRFGGCMAGLDRNIAESGLDCPFAWVTFSCSGVFNDRNTANKQFEMAQLADALNTEVSLWIDDTRRHNGICYANRIVSPGFGAPQN